MTTKSAFIKGIFGNISADTEGQPLFCGFPDDPLNNHSWPVKTMTDCKLPKIIEADNNYFTIASYRQGPQDRYHAKKEYIVAVHAIVLDDIGTKVKKKLKLAPSWKTRTSPGNYQAGFILETPCTDIKRCEAIIKELGKKGWSDPGMAGTARWARFPFGVNTKEEHLDDDGEAPKVGLVEWHPERLYSLEKIVKSFGLKLGTSAEDGDDSSKSENDSGDDAVLSALKNANLWKSELEPGQHDITCPWLHLHTDQADHGTVYFEPGLDNKQAGGFKCQHGHCSSRGISDLKEHLGISVEKQKAKSKLETAIELVDDIYVFHDENGEPLCFLEGNCRPLKSREVRANIFRKIYSTVGKEFTQNNLSEVMARLESKAICEGEQLKLHNRIAFRKGYIWYDLGNGMAVKVGCKGWKIEKAFPLFRRYGHQQVQCSPIPGGDPWKLFYFLNIAVAHQLETLVLLISYLVPEIAHPIFHPHGAQGSGKTTLCKIIKMLLDPSSMEVIFAPKNQQELIRQLNRHHIPLFDNMSRLDSEMSDILCAACTGVGIAKRTLFTDDDEHIFNLKRCVGLNGINLLITKPDLLDRTMLLHLERIPAKNRKVEAELWKEYNEAKPGILGGMFDILVKAKAIYPSLKLTDLPRMADFARWGYAIAEALGKGKGKQFMIDYNANVKRQNAEVLQNNSLCLAVMLFMKSKDHWEGTVKEAFEALSLIVEPSKTDNTFPADAKNLRRFLERIQTTLAESESITYCFSDKPRKNGFYIEFNKSKKG